MLRKSFAFLLFLLCLTCFCSASIEKYFRSVEHRTAGHSMRNIDFIYLINLDKRTDRLEVCKRELAPFGINPFRFPAVYGKDLSKEAYDEIGLRFLPGMKCDSWAVCFPSGGSGSPEFDFLRKSCYGKTYFSRWMSHGAVGVALSNLSILQDAYDAGYKTIWILEDDFHVVANPHQLSDLIDKLDQLVGTENWDILFTDDDGPDVDLQGRMWFLDRPDNGSFDISQCARRKRISSDFVKVGCRSGLYSTIIRRSGMKKILDFEKERGLYIPYDNELALVPGINMYQLSYKIMYYLKESPSDIR